MEQFIGLIGILTIFVLCLVMSNNRKAIDWHLVNCGISAQIIVAVFILRTPWGQGIFELLGHWVETLIGFVDYGTSFVLGPLNDTEKMVALFGPSGGFIFVFKLIPTLIFVSSLSAVAYHLGIMQAVVKSIARIVYRLMRASGIEATSNAASVFVGMLEAQLLIKPFLLKATQSELLAIMTGSMACISGAIMAVYIQMGVAAEFMMAASVMAIPGALVIAKIVYPEVEQSNTKSGIELEMEKKAVNLLDAVSTGAVEGLKVGAAASAVLIAMLALIAGIDYCVGKLGLLIADVFLGTEDSTFVFNADLKNLRLSDLLGAIFFIPAILMGVPIEDAATVGGLMGTKLVLNEFVAYSQLAPLIEAGTLLKKSEIIATFALCGFANFGSVAILIGGIGGMVPSRRSDLAKVGIRAMICGTFASYISASIVGVMYKSGSTNMAGDISIILVALAIIVFYNRRQKQ